MREKINVRLITGHEILAGVAKDGGVRILSAPKDIEVLGKHTVPKGLDLRKVDRNIFNVEYFVREGYAEMKEYPLIVVFKPEKRGELAKTIGKAKAVKEFGIIPAYAVRISPGEEFYAFGSTDVARKYWDGLAIGAALAGCILIIGENVCGG